MQPVTIEEPDPLLQRRERLSALLASHRRWRFVFAALSGTSLGGLSFLGTVSAESSGLVLRACLALAVFFLVNAVVSAWKSQILAARLRAMDEQPH